MATRPSSCESVLQTIAFPEAAPGLRGQAEPGVSKLGSAVHFSVKVDKAKRELSAGMGVRQVARLAVLSAASVSRLKASIGLLQPNG